jgi:hypothetical protein
VISACTFAAVVPLKRRSYQHPLEILCVTLRMSTHTYINRKTSGGTDAIKMSTPHEKMTSGWTDVIKMSIPHSTWPMDAVM